MIPKTEMEIALENEVMTRKNTTRGSRTLLKEGDKNKRWDFKSSFYLMRGMKRMRYSINFLFGSGMMMRMIWEEEEACFDSSIEQLMIYILE